MFGILLSTLGFFFNFACIVAVVCFLLLTIFFIIVVILFIFSSPYWWWLSNQKLVDPLEKTKDENVFHSAKNATKLYISFITRKEPNF